jgi:glycosyltransferase involved in cell wall biosynthesis
MTERATAVEATAVQATILQVLPKLDTGGAERVAIEIAEGLTTAGHRALLACDGGVLTQAALRAGAEILVLPLDTKSPLAIRRNAGRLAALIKAQKVDIVHAHSRAPAWSAYWAARRTGKKFVTTYHGTYSENAPFKRRYNAIMAAGDRVVAVSEFIAERIRARHPDIGDKLVVIPGGVDPKKFDPASVLGDRAVRLAQNWRLPLGAPTILLPGRLTGRKGQINAISALARLRHKDAVLMLVGSDQGRERYTKSLIAHAAALGVADRLRLAGHVEDMPAAMMLADIVLNASTTPEAFGRTIVEAQAMARVVIAADHGGARETIRDFETGFLFPPGDDAALAAAIDQVLDMPPEARIAFGRHARAVVSQDYSVASMQAAMLDVYAGLQP